MVSQVIIELAQLKESSPVVVTQLSRGFEVHDSFVVIAKVKVTLGAQLFRFWIPWGNLKQSSGGMVGM